MRSQTIGTKEGTLESFGSRSPTTFQNYPITYPETHIFYKLFISDYNNDYYNIHGIKTFPRQHKKRVSSSMCIVIWQLRGSSFLGSPGFRESCPFQSPSKDLNDDSTWKAGTKESVGSSSTVKPRVLQKIGILYNWEIYRHLRPTGIVRCRWVPRLTWSTIKSAAFTCKVENVEEQEGCHDRSSTGNSLQEIVYTGFDLESKKCTS